MAEPATEKSRPPRQSRFAGWLAAITGFVAFVGSIIPAFMAQEDGPDESLLMLLGVGLFAGGAALFTYGKRHLTRRAEDLLAADPRAPIIFLRSFGEEEQDFGIRGFFRSFRPVLTYRSMNLSFSTWGPTFQSQLAMVMDRIGPYLAVGRPGAKLPGTGAARLYIPDDQWQERVSELLRKARLVIVRAATSAGLSWEIKNVKRLIRPQQLLVILPPTNDGYTAFRDLIRSIGVEIPAKPPKAIFMTFDADWRPVPLGTTGSLEKTLAPYFRLNGIETPRPSAWDAVRLFFR